MAFSSFLDVLEKKEKRPPGHSAWEEKENSAEVT